MITFDSLSRKSAKYNSFVSLIFSFLLDVNILYDTPRTTIEPIGATVLYLVSRVVYHCSSISCDSK
jgi:hypothetical protein